MGTTFLQLFPTSHDVGFFDQNKLWRDYLIIGTAPIFVWARLQRHVSIREHIIIKIEQHILMLIQESADISVLLLLWKKKFIINEFMTGKSYMSDFNRAPTIHNSITYLSGGNIIEFSSQMFQIEKKRMHIWYFISRLSLFFILILLVWLFGWTPNGIKKLG